MFDFQKFCDHNRIDMAPASDRHARQGWINVQCPFCKHPDRYHLGWNTNYGYFRCWRCGKHRIVKTVAKLASTTTQRAHKVIQELQTDRPSPNLIKSIKERADKCALPSSTKDISKSLKDRALKYLYNRGFNWRTVKLWNIQKTLPLGYYKNRLVIPFYQSGNLVTFQARDFTKRQSPPYLACPKKDAVLDVKETLYGIDKAYKYDNAIVVEGVTDVWNVGPGAVATCGTSWVIEQALLLSNWKHIFILFDSDDPEAQNHADSLARAVQGLGTNTTILKPNGYKGDPAEMAQSMIRELRHCCNLKKWENMQ